MDTKAAEPADLPCRGSWWSFGGSESAGGADVVVLLQGGDLLVAELEVDGGGCVGEVVWLGGADDGGRDDGVVQHPRHGDLGHRDAAGLSDALDGVDDGPVAL